MRSALRNRAGMTLVELLVVVAIIGALAVTVLPNVVGTAESRRSREAARIVSSFVAKSQSRAIGRTEWAGCMLVPSGTAGPPAAAATDLYLADVPAAFRGNSGAITAAGPTSRQMPGTGAAPGDLIRFDGRDPWYEVIGVVTSTFNSVVSSTLTFRPRGSMAAALDDSGYEPHNTPWPADFVSHPFEILRLPMPAGSPVSLADGRVVDLSWSGFGPPAAYRRFSTPGQRITVLFDGTGRLRQVVGSSSGGSQRWLPTGPVFLLVGRVDRAGQASAPLNPADSSAGANWQYPDSYWIGIDLMSGVCKTAECAPTPAGADDLQKCVDSQRYIRQALLGDGR